jgi:hypothetical protein
MLAALFGEFTPHPWPQPSLASQDAYSLFYARSSAMGWLTGAVDGASGGLWGMNEGECHEGPDSRPARVAWFQVGVTEPVPTGRPLPVQPFLTCCGDVVARLGALRLHAVEVLLPVQCLATAADTSVHRGSTGMLISATNWFADSHPDSGTPLRVTLDGGPDPAIRSAAPRIFQWIQEINQDVFSSDSFSLSADDHVVVEPAVADSGWLGPARHRATFHGTLAEWSLDAVGWLAAFLADACSRHGVTTPMVLTAGR